MQQRSNTTFCEGVCTVCPRFQSFKQFLGLKSEANVEVPYTCISSNDHQGVTTLVAKRNLLVYKSLRKNSTSHMIYYLSKHFPNVFMVSITSFMSTSIQQDVHFVNNGPIKSKIANKSLLSLGHGYIVITLHCIVIYTTSLKF